MRARVGADMIRMHIGRSPARLARRLATLVGGGILILRPRSNGAGDRIAQTLNPQTPNPCRAAGGASGKVSGTRLRSARWARRWRRRFQFDAPAES